jgi:hypothetical protein
VSTASPQSPLLTPTEAARWLRSSQRSLERWRLEGTGPVFIRIGRRIGYRLDDLSNWVERCKCEPSGASANTDSHETAASTIATGSLPRNLR